MIRHTRQRRGNWVDCDWIRSKSYVPLGYRRIKLFFLYFVTVFLDNRVPRPMTNLFLFLSRHTKNATLIGVLGQVNLYS